jgi:hypothetical protein
VNDPQRIEHELSKLREEFPILVELPALSPEFGAWLAKLFLVVKHGFGVSSNEMQELRSISPELPSEFYDVIERNLQSLDLNDEWTDELIKKLVNDVPQMNFRHRLYQYLEFIGACIYVARSQPHTRA